MQTISPQTALIYVMVIVSASDGALNEQELISGMGLIRNLPAFQGFDQDRARAVAQDCAAILQEPEGLQTALALVADALAAPLRETAYWVALEMVLSDGAVALEEIRMVEVIRRALGIDKLVAAALERGARARFQVS